jgi:hypothetical protein
MYYLSDNFIPGFADRDTSRRSTLLNHLVLDVELIVAGDIHNIQMCLE